MNREHFLLPIGEVDEAARQEFRHWRAAASNWTSATSTRIPLSEVKKWKTAQCRSSYNHASGMFFSVIGIEHRNGLNGSVETTAMINQPEVGLLGLAIARTRLGMAALIQAKAEPGTIGRCQLSPTVQATRSNQLRAHGGKAVPLLELFDAPDRVILDTMQSEHGGIFWKKRNRSMIIQVTHFRAPPGYRWIKLVDLLAVVAEDNLVHSDLRTILSLGPFWRWCSEPHLSVEAQNIIDWLEGHQARAEFSVKRVPLHNLAGWRRQHFELARDDGYGHEIVGVRVSASGREVDHWDQLMVKPRNSGLVALAVRRKNGALQALVRACNEPGARKFVEIGPTVQIGGGELPNSATQRDLARKLLPIANGRRQTSTLYDGWLSDEGGRFFHSESRYVVIDKDLEPPNESYRWFDVPVLANAARADLLLNIQARDSLVCLMSSLVSREMVCEKANLATGLV